MEIEQSWWRVGLRSAHFGVEVAKNIQYVTSTFGLRATFACLRKSIQAKRGFAAAAVFIFFRQRWYIDIGSNRGQVRKWY